MFALWLALVRKADFQAFWTLRMAHRRASESLQGLGWVLLERRQACKAHRAVMDS